MRTRRFRHAWLAGFPRSLAWEVLVLDAAFALILYFLLTAAGPVSDFLWGVLQSAQGLLWTLAVFLAAVAAVALARLADRRSVWVW